MSSLNRFVQRDVGLCPFVRSVKSNPAVGAALVTGAASVLGNLLGFGSNESSNQTNLEIARQNAELQRETNAQNYKMFQEQNAWNEEMWNKQNEYNSPKAQMERLRAAGINPNAVFGNNSVAQAGSISSQTAPQFTAPQVNAKVNPYFPNFQVGEAVNAYMQSELNNSLRKKYNAEAAHTETLNQFDQRSMDARLKSLDAIARGDDWRAEIARMEKQYIEDSYYWRIRQVKNDVTMQGLSQEEMQQKIYAHKLANGLAEVQLAYAPKLNEAQLKQYYSTVAQIQAQIGLINANTLLTNEQKLSEVQRRVGTIIENGLKSFDFKERKELFGKMLDYTTQTIQGEMDSPEFSKYTRWFDWGYDKLRGLIPFASPSNRRQPQTIRRDYYNGGYLEQRY